MKRLTWLLSLTLLTACASVHKGNMAEQTGGDKVDGLLISAVELSDPSKEGFSMIAFNFENQSQEWMKFEKAEVEIDEHAAKTVSVVRGKDLVDWSAAMAARQELQKQNREMAQLGLVALGAVAVVASGGKNNGAALAGAGALGAAEGWALADAIRYGQMRAENPKADPDNYIYSSFSVPPKMFLRKWVLLNKPVGKQITILPIIVTFVDGRQVNMNVKLKSTAEL